MSRKEFKKRRVKLYQTPEIVRNFLALQFKDFGIDFTAVNSRPLLGWFSEQSSVDLAWVWHVGNDTYLLFYPHSQKERVAYVRGKVNLELASANSEYRFFDVCTISALGHIRKLPDLSYFIEIDSYEQRYRKSPLWTTVRPGDEEKAKLVIGMASRLPLKKRNRHRFDEKKIEAMM